MILICYVLVSNWLKYYLRKRFSSKSCDLLERPRHLVIVCYVLGCIWKKINLALETYFVLLVSHQN